MKILSFLIVGIKKQDDVGDMEICILYIFLSDICNLSTYQLHHNVKFPSFLICILKVALGMFPIENMVIFLTSCGLVELVLKSFK